MANTSSRTLRLLTLLQTHRTWSGPELAARLGVTDRTLRRDIDRLRELGYPVRSTRGIDGGYQLAAGATMPPLVVDAEESVAIVVALGAAAQGAAAVLGDAPVRALAKVVQVLPRALRKRADAVRQATVAPEFGEAPAVDLDLFTLAAQCCRDTVRMTFGYAARDGVRTERRVEPHHLVPMGRRWYLVAWDLNRGDWRCFRLDRMTAAEGSTFSFGRREVPGGDAVDFVRAGLRSADRDHTVTLRVAGPAGEVEKAIGAWATITAESDESCTVVITANGVEWICFALVALPYRVEVLAGDESGELRTMVEQWRDRLTGVV